jgi:23S rRNA pseudouridine2605 synthase
MSRDSQGPRKTFSKSGSSDFNKRKSYSSSDKSKKSDSSERKPYEKREGGEKRPYAKREGGSYESAGPRKSFGDGERKPYAKREDGKYESAGPRKSFGDGERKPYAKRDDDEKRPYVKREDGKYESAGPRKSFGDGERKPYAKREDGEKRPYVKREGSSYGSDGPRKSFGDGERKPYAKREDGEKRSYVKREGNSYGSDSPRKSFGDGERKPYAKREDGEKRPYVKREGSSYGSDSPRKSFGDGERKPYAKREDGEKRSYVKREGSSYGSDSPRKSFGDGERKPYVKREGGSFEGSRPRKSFDDGEKKPFTADRKVKGEYRDFDKPYEPKLSRDQKVVERSKKSGPSKTSTQKNVSDDAVRLNRYVANSGVCSRREADVLIATGVVSVNGKIVTEMGYKVNPTDVVNYGGVPIKNEVKKYLVLNKPKDYITTMDDPEERKTVMELIRKACKERLYPVGRLDRNTTGVLLFTNDGDLTSKLTHPKFGVRKIYHVILDKRISSEDFKTISEGFELADGFIKPDAIEYVGEGKSELGVEIHSGRNRIVRRIFEHLGYEVMKLDRVAFAGLTKKDLPRSKFRFLTPKEVDFLKMLG